MKSDTAQGNENLGAEAGEIMRKIDDTIRQAERLVQQTDDFYNDLGLTRGVAKQFMFSDRVSTEQREEMLSELHEWERGVLDEINITVENEKQQNSPNRSRSQKIMNLQLTKI